MKTKLLSAMLFAFALMAFDAAAGPLQSYIHGPVTFNWTIYQANLVNMAKYAGNGKTNITGTGANKATNVVQIRQNSYTTTPFGNNNVLALLENSLDTNFPSGTKLASDGSKLYVVDSTGTNVIVNISSILSVGNSNSVRLGMSMDTTVYKKSGTSISGSGSLSGFQFISLKYDDSALKTKDGSTTQFKFEGVSSSSDSDNFTVSTNDIEKITYSGSFTIHGSGDGTIRSKGSILTGTVIGMPSGTDTIFIP